MYKKFFNYSEGDEQSSDEHYLGFRALFRVFSQQPILFIHIVDIWKYCISAEFSG
jgi:hypothetical protein